MSNLSGFVKRLRDIMRNDAGINGDAQRIEQIAWMLFLKVYDAKEQDWEFDDEGYSSIIPEVCRWQNWAHDDKSGTALTGEQLLNFVNNTLFPTLKKLPVDASTPIKKAIVQTTFADANNYMKDGVLLRQVINVIDELDLSDYEESHVPSDIRYEDKVDEENCLHFLLTSEASGFGTRIAGERVRNKVLNHLKRIDTPSAVNIDFSGISMISSSFADEFLGKMLAELGFFRFTKTIFLSNVSEVIEPIINRSVAQRMAAIYMGEHVDESSPK